MSCRIQYKYGQIFTMFFCFYKDNGLRVLILLDYTQFNQLGDRGKMTGVWLEHCQPCSVPEIASVFNRPGIQYDFVTGYLHDEEAWAEIEAWTEAARVAAAM